MSVHDAERAYVAAVLDARAAQLADTTASMTVELDRLRESWSSGYDQELEAHQQRMDAMRDETARFIKDLTGAADDEQAPARDVAARGSDASLPSPSGSPDGHNPGQQPTNPHEAELVEADRIRRMPMDQFMAERERLGIRASTSMSHLFGETR